MPYRYEDLGDKAFQRLCAALLVHLDDRVQVPPLGQSDGGFDAFRRQDGEITKIIGHQVKWTSTPHEVKNPVAWLLAKLEGERQKIKRMSLSGTEVYLVITNVPSTSRPEVGRLDRMDAAIVDLGKELNILIWVWWRADLDARLDAAPAELTFSYPDMLVGPDAMRALLADALQSATGRRHSALVRAAARTALHADRNVGFRQADLEGIPIDDLFVDVTATRTFDLGTNKRDHPPRGALQLLQATDCPPRTMFFGAPGQGKSTLIQQLCQGHRRRLVDEDSAEQSGAQPPRLAFKIVLRDYAQWIAGIDPFDPDGGKRPRGSADSVEAFVARLLRHDSGGLACSVDDVAQIGDRFPTLFAFDGLDEVADVSTRSQVVEELGHFTARSSEWGAGPQLVVTSRPSFDRLPEPSNDIFINHNLDSLSESLRIEYLRKWAVSQDLSARDRRKVERIFRERSGDEHVRELATNPMQLTILLYLINQRGDSVPERRTELYAGYLRSFLDREAATSRTVRLHRDLLEEVTAFLGWHLQSRAESESGAGRAPRADLVRASQAFPSRQ